MAFVWKLARENYKNYGNNLNKLIKIHKQLYCSDIINWHRKDARVI